MIDRSDSIAIDRPVEEVFAYVTDTSNDPEWHTDILEARKVSEGPIGMGTKWHLRFKPFMGNSEGEMEVVAFEPNQTEVLRAVMGPMQPTLAYRFEPANGGTRFTRHIRIKMSGVMRLMVPFMQWIDAPRRNRRFVSKPQTGPRAERVMPDEREERTCSRTPRPTAASPWTIWRRPGSSTARHSA